MIPPTIRSKQENPSGLHQHYAVTKADGSPCDPNAIYFVLRLDNSSKNPAYVKACRKAARTLVEFAPNRHMADELHTLLDRLEGKYVEEDENDKR